MLGALGSWTVAVEEPACFERGAMGRGLCVHVQRAPSLGTRTTVCVSSVETDTEKLYLESCLYV